MTHATAIAMDCVTPTLKIKLNNIPTQEKRAKPTGRAKKWFDRLLSKEDKGRPIIQKNTLNNMASAVKAPTDGKYIKSIP